MLAKLPAPSDEAKAKAAEIAAKTAWSGKVDIYLLCKSQDKVAASYYKTAKASGKDIKAASATPPCADPGAFAYVPDAAKPVEVTKPLEAAGAHSPPTTAASPPNTKVPDAVINPGNKAATSPAKKVVETAKPLEAAGAHSPPATAASPPNTKIPDAVINPGNKAATPSAK